MPLSSSFEELDKVSFKAGPNAFDALPPFLPFDLITTRVASNASNTCTRVLLTAVHPTQHTARILRHVPDHSMVVA
jgi:hypothetical protein